MASSTVVLITGVTQGIGKTLLKSFLQRPNHTVIGSVRDKTSSAAQELHTLPVADGTSLLLVKIESLSTGDPAAAVREIEDAGIHHIDLVIANAGGMREAVAPLEAVTADDAIETFHINALGPLLLFQAVRSLLQASPNAPKWVSVSSLIGSIGHMTLYHSHFTPAYGMSKAGLNWITMAAHCGNPWLIAFCVNPGLVQSVPGNRSARSLGMEKAPITLEQSVGAILGIVDKATRETTSAKFFQAVTGEEISW